MRCAVKVFGWNETNPIVHHVGQKQGRCVAHVADISPIIAVVGRVLPGAVAIVHRGYGHTLNCTAITIGYRVTPGTGDDVGHRITRVIDVILTDRRKGRCACSVEYRRIIDEWHVKGKCRDGHTTGSYSVAGCEFNDAWCVVGYRSCTVVSYRAQDRLVVCYGIGTGQCQNAGHGVIISSDACAGRIISQYFVGGIKGIRYADSQPFQVDIIGICQRGIQGIRNVHRAAAICPDNRIVNSGCS